MFTYFSVIFKFLDGYSRNGIMLPMGGQLQPVSQFPGGTTSKKLVSLYE